MGERPAIVCLTASGRALAEEIAGAVEGKVHGRTGRVEGAAVAFQDTAAHVADLFLAGVPVVGLCATGILIRALAPLVADKRGEPPVLAVAEHGRKVVPLLGGHRGANDLARRIAGAIGGEAIVTTAGDAALGLALDAPPAGWLLANPDDAGPVMARLLAGEGARIEGEVPFDCTALAGGDGVGLVATDKPLVGDDRTLVYHPQLYCLGVGAARHCRPGDLIGLAERVLAEAGIAEGALAGLFSIDLKMDERAVLDCAARFGVPARFFDAATLEREFPRLKNPSEAVYAEVGCHGVAEGAALAASGPQGELVVAKQKTDMATAALARAPAPLAELPGQRRGLLSVVGIGPGAAAMRTPEATRAIHAADELVGYSLYLDLLGPLAAVKPKKAFELGDEEARCRYALERAGEGAHVALVCSGDPGIYAMAALVFELAERATDAGGVGAAARRSAIEVVPGVSAMQAAAARLGAPLGHDFCAISLSDLLTPRTAILARVDAAAAADFVIAFYNPVSHKRRDLLEIARSIVLRHRAASTPVALAVNLGRAGETVLYRTLGTLSVEEVDMLTTVVVGSSASRAFEHGGGTRLYTPRGYAARIGAGLP